MTSRELADRTIKAVSKIDHTLLNHISKTYSRSEKEWWCRLQVEDHAPEDATQNMIGRAAKLLYGRLFA